MAGRGDGDLVRGGLRGDDLRHLAEIAVSLARAAGARLLERSSAAGPARDVTASAESKSSRTDLVTDADRESERLVVDALRRERPGDGVVAEEGTQVAGRTGLVWVIDPLDGTTNYLYGLPVWAVSIACRRESDGAVLSGAVFDPLRDEMFSATRGGGAYRDGARLGLGTGPDLAAPAAPARPNCSPRCCRL